MYVNIYLPHGCYDLDSVLSKKHTLVLGSTRELDRVPKYKTSILYTKLQGSCTSTSLAYPKGHIFALRPTYVLYIVITLSF